jgi:hypothetical protein
MLRKISIVFLLIFCLLTNVKGDIYSKKKFDFVASFDNISITKFDLDNFIQIEQYDKKIKDKSEKNYKKTLDQYIDLLIRNKIVKKYSLTLSDEEKKKLWTFFSGDFKTKLSLEGFCEENGIEKAFFTRYLTIEYLWEKFVSGNVVNKIKIDESQVEQFVEFNMKKNSGLTRYNLSEITINYKNNEEQTRVISILEEVYGKLKKNPKNFEKYVQKYSQSASKSDGGFLGEFSDGDLSEEIIVKIKNIRVGDVSDIICVEKSLDGGNCFFFKINAVETGIKVDEENKQKIKMYIKNKKIEEELNSLIEKTKKESVVKIWDERDGGFL